MTREGALTKGERYLLSGRLTIRLVTPERIEAHVKGDSGHTYEVIFRQRLVGLLMPC